MSSRAPRLAALALLLPACSADVNDGSVDPAVTLRVSVSAAGEEANRECRNPDVTPDGRYVVFESAASNLVPGDVNGKVDIFRKDLRTGEILLVSVGTAGEQGDGDSTNPSVSEDGTRVAFVSVATNLAPTDGVEFTDVYVRKIPESETIHVSQAALGGLPSHLGNQPQSGQARLSPDGNFVVFVSNGEDLDGTNPNYSFDFQVFLHDLGTSETRTMSVRPDQTPAEAESARPDVSRDGLFVVFSSTATDIAPGDANEAEDVFLRDVLGESTQRLSVEHPSNPDGLPDGENSNGGSRNPRVTPDGRFVAFESSATDLTVGAQNSETAVFRLDRSTGEMRLVSRGVAGGAAANGARDAVLTPDGRFVAFWSLASNHVAGDTNNRADQFWHDTRRGTTYRVSVRTGGGQTFLDSVGRPAIIADGRFVVFASEGSDLAVGDTNGVSDVFIRGPLH
ncbi:MAG TPA: hypothetical protein VEJ18_05010 [Planctomycetota bacterium]|nr:hypothetical protein [Planctomycetota bacterium]